MTSSSRCSFQQRKTHLLAACSTLHNATQTRPSALDADDELLKHYTRNVYVSDRSELLICVPFKSGSTSVLTLLAMANMNLTEADIARKSSKRFAISNLYSRKNRELFGIYNLGHHYTPMEIRVRLKSYKKVIMTRDPFRRLLSMYIDKFTSGSNGTCYSSYMRSGGVARRILLRHRKRLTAAEWACANTVKFHEFLNYYATNIHQLQADVHLIPNHQWCHPCDIDYDVIMKLETGCGDLQYLARNVLNTRLSSDNSDGCQMHKNKALARDASIKHGAEDMFRQLEAAANYDIQQIRDVYRLDAQTFGYDVTNVACDCCRHGSRSGGSECC